jgi:hypothetical protein
MLRSSSIKSGGGDLKSSPGSGDSDPELFPCGPTAAPVSTATGPRAPARHDESTGPASVSKKHSVSVFAGCPLCWFSETRERKRAAQPGQRHLDSDSDWRWAGAPALLGVDWAGGRARVDWEDGIDFHNNNPAQNSVRIKVRRRAAADSLPLRIRVNSKITGLTQAETSCRYKFFWTTDLFSGSSSGGH